MELRQLRTFVAVAEEGHVTRAAERLYLAQSAVSRQLAALEAELGTQLFVRDPWRGVRLTEPGRLLLHNARELLDRAAALRVALTEEQSQHPPGRAG